MPEKRGTLIFLVIATVLVFVGVVWALATYLPLNLGGEASPTTTQPGLSTHANCVHAVAYWKDHSESYPAQMVIAEQVYTAGDIGFIFTNTANDARDELRAQLAGAYLNIRWGADQSYIESILFEAYGWLVDHPSGNQLSDGDREQATRLYNLLEAYNQGLTGVEACEPRIELTETITVRDTAISSATLTSSQSSTATPSETPTPSEMTPTATYIYIPPTNTKMPTTAPPIQRPTNTKVPPTERPVPTNTQRPPETATYTPPPAPTATFTLPPLPTATFTLPPPP
jgi:hypothetical protein